MGAQRTWLLLVVSWLVTLSVWSNPPGAGVNSKAVAQSESKTKIALGLYKSSEEPDPKAPRLAKQIAPVLSSLGWKLELWDVEKGLPPAQVASKIGAVITWFGSPKITDALGYVRWLAQQNRSGKKVLVLGNFGAHTSDGTTWLTNEQLNEFFYPFGLDYKAAYTSDTSLLTLVSSDAMAKPPSPLSYYRLFVLPIRRTEFIWLSVEPT